MKYIEKVILENFQSHKNSVIEFDSQLNVIVGPSDSGKTAILRGIRWALYNEPSGDYFIREGESECSVTIVFNDGTKIKRYRSKTRNSYFLYDSNNNETKFEGFGISVPQEIIDKTGIKKILLDSDLSSAINLSDQLEGSFLLSERGSTRASSMGRLVGVNIIDDALRETLKDSRNLASNKRNIDENILELEKELTEYDYLEELGKKINDIEVIRDKIQIKSNTLSKYKVFLEKILYLSQEKKELYYYVDKLKGIHLLDNTLNHISSSINRYEYFNKQNNIIYKLSLNKKENIKIINAYKNINLAEKHIEKMDSLYNLQLRLNKIKSKLQIVTLEIDKLTLLSNKLQSIDLVQENIKKINNSTQQLENLKNIKDKEYSLRKSLAIGNKYVDQLKDIDKVSNIQIELQNKLYLVNKLIKLSSIYTLNNEDIKSEKTLLHEYKDSIEKQLIEYKDVLLKQGTCPLCFSTIDNNKASHIISHYI